MKSCDTSRELFQSYKQKSACADKSHGNEGEDPRESKASKILSSSAVKIKVTIHMEATVIKKPEVLHFSNNPVEKIKNL